MLEKMWYLPATGAFSLPELVAVSCRSVVSHRSELKVSDVHSPGFMFGTVTSAELKTRVLTSPVGACAACTAAIESQDKTRRRLICVFICSSLSEIRKPKCVPPFPHFALRQYQGPRPSTLHSSPPHTQPMTPNLCPAQGLLSLLID